MKKLLTVVFLMVALAAGVLGWAQHRYEQQHLAFDTAPVRLEIKPGDNLRRVGARLSELGVPVPGWAMSVVGRVREDASQIKAGTYQLQPPLTLRGLIDKLVAGEVMSTEVRIIEGWRFDQMRAAVLANPDLKHEVSELSETDLLKRLGSERKKAEGLFFPSTYKTSIGASDLDIYRQAFRELDRVLNEEWDKRQPDLPLKDPYDALRLASIVEKETGIEEDRDIIAGVFINRLRINMMLQSDPTTIYGLGDKFDGDLKRIHLRTDTPYNTYTRKGLTPTPIALVSRASIRSVLNPATTKALYFVARGDGSSQFSETLRDHHRAVRKYQLKKK